MVTPQGAVTGEDRVCRASRGSAIAPGVGELRFERMAGRTVLTRVFATSPLKVLNPNTAGRAAWACLATYGGGLVSGDALQIGLETGEQKQQHHSTRWD